MTRNPTTRDTLLQALKEIDETRQALEAIYLLTEPADNRDEFTQNVGCLAKAIARQISDPWMVLYDWVHEHTRADADDEKGGAL